ncbi:hypothetical protein TRFO_24331 [Tritrichomonas foetus]|uniref:Uncharacterized protein n=1 Tax=Tritrichomonas foetus TaxID=1144522 RepID=A0A1J4K973_9EUKA|nr:hypothetical protein TRFO_24331 [Tritrichomonas foetus]|eukprot:OHT07440.1 hypothetical protein TRFO_24331 [Tritrichomonas foetus]
MSQVLPSNFSLKKVAPVSNSSLRVSIGPNKSKIISTSKNNSHWSSESCEQPGHHYHQKHTGSLFWWIYIPFFIFSLTRRENAFTIKDFFFVFEKLAPYGFMRIRSEQDTLRPFFSSIEGAIFRGVIVYIESTDDTEKILFDFVKTHPYFSIYKYPYIVKRKNITILEERLDYFYNFALSKIPKNAWFIKLDADNIYSSESLLKVMSIPKNDNELICLPYLNMYCNITTKTPFFLYHDGIVKNVCDHWLLKNVGCYFEIGNKADNSSAELLITRRGIKKIRGNVQALHFPFQKSRRASLLKKERLSNMYIENEESPIIDKCKCDKSLCNYNKFYQACNDISKQMDESYNKNLELQNNHLIILDKAIQITTSFLVIFLLGFIIYLFVKNIVFHYVRAKLK